MNTKEKAIHVVLGFKDYLIHKHHEEVTDDVIKEIEKITAFTILAHCAGLTHYYANVYVDEHHAHFVQTRFGFQPQETFNKGLINRELYHQIGNYKEEIKKKDAEIENLKHSNEFLVRNKIETDKENKELKKQIASEYEAQSKLVIRNTIDEFKKKVSYYLLSMNSVLNQSSLHPYGKLHSMQEHVEKLWKELKEMEN